MAHGRCMRTDTAVSTRPKRSARVCGARPRGRGAATIAPTWRVSYASEGHAPVLSAAREHRQIGQAWRVCAAPLARPPRPPRTRCGRTGRPRPRRRTRQASTATTRDCAASREGARGRASRPLRRALAFPAATTRCRSEWPTFTCHKVSCPRGHCGRPPVLRSSSGARPSAAAVSDQRRHTCRASGQRGVRGQRQRTASEDSVRGQRQRRWAVRRACEPPSLRLESGLCKGWSSHDLRRTA